MGLVTFFVENVQLVLVLFYDLINFLIFLHSETQHIWNNSI